MTGINDLPTEMLHKIIQLLPVNGRLCAGRVCRRWRHTARRAWNDIKKLNIIQPENLSLCETRSLENLRGFAAIVKDELYITTNDRRIINCLVPKVGLTIENFLYDFDDKKLKQVLSIVTKHCRNLKSINLFAAESCDADSLIKLCRKNKKIQEFSVQLKDMRRLLSLKDLKKMTIELDKFNPRCEKNIVSLINKSQQTLVEIDLNHWSPKIISAVSECPSLKAMTFESTEETASSLSLLHNIPILTALTELVIYSDNLDYNSLIKLLQQCENLRVFAYWGTGMTLSDDTDDPVLFLPQLKSLEMNGTTIPEEMLIRLLKVKHLVIHPEAEIVLEIITSEDLEILEFHDSCEIPLELINDIVEEAEERHQVLKLGIPQNMHEEALPICANSKIQLMSTPIPFFYR